MGDTNISWRVLAAIYLASLAVRILTALPLQQPGYFDAYFYYDVAEELSQGRGFSAPFLWNYLDEPQSLPHPTNTYWMPMSSLLIALSFLILGVSYAAAQIPLIILSATVPAIAFYLGHKIYGGRYRAAMAAILTIFSGFYMSYWVSPDNFAPFAVSASLALLLVGKAFSEDQPLLFGLAGIFAGLSHLSRPDGFLLGLVVAMMLLWKWRGQREELALRAGLTLAGYLLVMGPWFLYNWSTVGTPFPTVGAKTIFLQRYEDLFSYSQELNLESYLAWGWQNILSSKLQAGIHIALVVLGGLQFFLAPFALLGLWRNRHHLINQTFLVYLLLLYLTMSLVFSFPSVRGSMLHSSVALLPFLFAAVPSGLEAAVEWVAKRRRSWDVITANRFFGIGFSGLAVLVSLFLYANGLFFDLSANPLAPLWNERNTVYQEVDRWLQEQGDSASAVMVVDPPGFWYFTDRPAIAIPSDGPEVAWQVAQKFGAEYLILEVDHPTAFRGIYSQQIENPNLLLLNVLQDPLSRPVYIYRWRGVE